MKANTINEVILHLDQIIADCKQKSSRHGYFASMYRKMTLGVKHGIEQGLFEDGPRMEHLDVVFANRYLEAYDAYLQKSPPTHSWISAFDAASNNNLIVLQHLLLGMNAHINLDLGIAVAVVCNKHSIAAMQKDYLKINNIIASFFGIMQDNLSKIAFPMYFIKRISPEATNVVLNFSISKAREMAWNNALLLAEVGNVNSPDIITHTDGIVQRVAQQIIYPSMTTSWLIKAVRKVEQNDIAKNIGFLNE